MDSGYTCDNKNRLGHGAVGFLILCEKNGEKFAIKFSKVGKFNPFDREEAKLKQLFYKDNEELDDACKHPNLLRYYRLTETERKDIEKGATPYFKFLNSNDYYTILHKNKFIKLDYCQEDATDYFNIEDDTPQGNINFKNKEHSTTFEKHVFNGLYYLFKRRIVHFDIKFDNILVKQTDSGPIFKIGDFGMAQEYYFDHKLYLGQGTPGYIPGSINNKTGKITDTYPLYFTSFGRDLYGFFIMREYLNQGKRINEEEITSLMNDNGHRFNTIEACTNNHPCNDISESAYEKFYEKLFQHYELTLPRSSLSIEDIPSTDFVHYRNGLIRPLTPYYKPNINKELSILEIMKSNPCRFIELYSSMEGGHLLNEIRTYCFSVHKFIPCDIAHIENAVTAKHYFKTMNSREKGHALERFKNDVISGLLCLYRDYKIVHRDLSMDSIIHKDGAFKISNLIYANTFDFKEVKDLFPKDPKNSTKKEYKLYAFDISCVMACFKSLNIEIDTSLLSNPLFKENVSYERFSELKSAYDALYDTLEKSIPLKKSSSHRNNSRRRSQNKGSRNTKKNYIKTSNTMFRMSNKEWNKMFAQTGTNV